MMPRQGASGGRYLCDGAHDQTSIVSVPRKNPSKAKVVAEPVLFPDGGNDGTSGTMRGFDVFKLDDPAVAGRDNSRYRTLNAQTQERF